MRRNDYIDDEDSKLIMMMMMMMNYIQVKKGLGGKPGVGLWWFYTLL